MAQDRVIGQVEVVKNTTSKIEGPSTDQIDEHKPCNADGKTMSNTASSSASQIAAPQLDDQVVEMPVVIEGLSGAEQVQLELKTALFELRANVLQSDACHNLFNTVELLENILSKLPIKDLLFAQSVCKTWKNCIAHSKILQRGLFLAPPKLKPIEMIYDTGDEGNLQTALYAKADASDTAEVKFLRTCFTFCANPLLVCAFGSDTLATYLLDSSKSPRVEERFTRPEASWKRMTTLYPSLEFPDIFLPLKQQLKSFALSREEAIERTGGHLMMVLWEESLRRLAHAGTAFVCEAAQKYETAEQLASAVDKLKQGEKL
ncbi:uncharacterized protein RHO25_011659 [Cercospora beticola]|uniref:F-box domain-containing protein n=1 Tax=Cercospora beticola TaxID=122368 RepID=A0ABZ0P560_CERBT|nr:hypothetical protein RHO25_011659 [Cercospora beticola]CAK1366935.1 unnamed protein product [Cercospora beticola]